LSAADMAIRAHPSGVGASCTVQQRGNDTMVPASR
jgi:hypothetical protein